MAGGGLRIGLMMRNGDYTAPGAGRAVRWRELRDIAQAAEGVGVETLFVPDHLLFRRDASTTSVPEGETRGLWEAFTLLGALAEATRWTSLGPFVACTAFRNPALTAKMAHTLDELSDGRAILGLGAGYHRPEFEAYGLPFESLASRFDEALQIIVPLVREGYVDFRGRYYQAPDCELRLRGPRPAGPPIWIGARAPRMMRLTARWADAYNSPGHHRPEELAAPWRALEEACREVGRDPASILRTSACHLTFPGAAEDPAGLPKVSIDGEPAQVAERLHALHQAGVEHMTVYVTPWSVKGVRQLGRTIGELRGLEG